jgi:uncharacterized protein YbjT (DUF2867 family)
MRVFLTRANGWIGSAIARDLLEAGHSVMGLVRSDDKGKALSAVRVTISVGSLGDVSLLRKSVKEADGVVHTAFGLDLPKIEELADEHRPYVPGADRQVRGRRAKFFARGHCAPQRGQLERFRFPACVFSRERGAMV